MKIAVKLALTAVIAVLALAGCKPASPHVTSSASSAAHQELVIAKGTARGCLMQGSWLTAAGRLKIRACLANAVPRQNAYLAEQCAQDALLHRHREDGLAACLVKYGKVSK